MEVWALVIVGMALTNRVHTGEVHMDIVLVLEEVEVQIVTMVLVHHQGVALDLVLVVDMVGVPMVVVRHEK